MRAGALLLLAAATTAVSAQAAPIVLDDFEAPERWVASASEGVTGTGTKAAGASGAAVRLDYDFSRGSGYAVLRRALPLDLSGNFALRFKLRGEGLANALEVKLVDASGENVWWHRYPDLVPPSGWTDFAVKRRHVKFAWGPTSDKALRRIAAIEFVVAAGKGGGKGWIAVDDLTLERLPEPPAVPPPVTARGGGRRAVDGSLATIWSGCGREPLDLDLGYQREFGGLLLRWGANAATDYSISLSANARTWRTVRTVRRGDGKTDWLRLPESEARYVRVQPAGSGTSCDLAEVEVKPLDFGETANAFVAAVARDHPRGLFPRGFVGEQNYWTLIATPAGGESALMDEDGAIEVRRGGFTVEPFVQDAEGLVSWAQVRSRQSLLDGIYPVPTVQWSADGWSLTTTAYAVTVGQTKQLVGEYALANDTNRPLSLQLAVRPFQVNPPQQFLNIHGGVSPIGRVSWRKDGLHVNGRRALVPLTQAAREMASTFDAGMLPHTAPWADRREAVDETGLASAAMVFEAVPPGERRTYRWVAPLDDQPIARQPPPPTAAARDEWAAALGDVRLKGPPAAAATFSTISTALAHILATREGPALRPGSRAYARSWIRDGAMMSTALLRMGLAGDAERFLAWYAPFQYPSGKIPCCVDPRGADPVPEHDSEGEFIHLVAQLHRFDPDAERSRRMWPRVRAAADYIETLRRQTMVPANRATDRAHFYGLLPPSISHEGYSAKPMHSYWDDFWALGGLRDAAWLAGELALADQARILTARGDAFQSDILTSIGQATQQHRIAFIPGSADLGDFDATSTTVALTIAGVQDALPQPRLRATFDRYWTEADARRKGSKAWDAYTPYEWRNVGAFVRLGWRDRAHALAEFLMADRRPAAWNQWAEVVGRAPREPRFVGDMPHGWVASDFINATLDRLAFERPKDEALVLAAGVPQSWIEGDGLAVEKLRTPYGVLSYTLRRAGQRTLLTYRLSGKPPAGGLVLAAPGSKGETRLEGSNGRLSLPFDATARAESRNTATAAVPYPRNAGE